MFRGRPAPPFWFVLLFGIGEAFVLRWLMGLHGAGDPSGSPAPPVTLAFWFLFGLVVGWIWTGVQVAGRISLTVLTWSVQALWAFARAIANAGIAIGRAVILASHGVWDFFKLTYTNVLKPAWDKFWRVVESVQRTLERVFRPVFNFLDKIRSWVIRVYEDYVRPVLDIIDISRRVLRVLSALGIDWARALERKLAELEEKIQLPFTYVLGKINEIVNIVNRVVTADGLFQRLAYIRTLERDIKYAVRAWHNSQSKPLTQQDRDDALQRDNFKTGAQIIHETRVYLDTGQGPHAASISEWSLILASRLRNA